MLQHLVVLKKVSRHIPETLRDVRFMCDSSVMCVLFAYESCAALLGQSQEKTISKLQHYCLY